MNHPIQIKCDSFYSKPIFHFVSHTPNIPARERYTCVVRDVRDYEIAASITCSTITADLIPQ